MFDSYDRNKDGTIDIDELKSLINEIFMDELLSMSDTGLKMLQEMLKSLARDIMRELDKDGLGVLNWSEFKKYKAVAKEKEEEVRTFIKKFAKA